MQGSGWKTRGGRRYLDIYLLCCRCWDPLPTRPLGVRTLSTFYQDFLEIEKYFEYSDRFLQQSSPVNVLFPAPGGPDSPILEYYSFGN